LEYLNFQEKNMPALNRVQLIGYLGENPETRFTSTGKKVTQFTLGITQRWKASGETKEHTEWVNIEVWGKLSDITQEYIHKGSLIYVDGRLKTDRYEENGDVKYFTKVVVVSLQMLDRKGSDESLFSVEEEQGEYDA
jgi:single-strand DNA-binding protein